MSVDRAFVDTNLFIYLYSESELDKKKTVEQVLSQYDRFISTQVINEFCNVAIRKLNLPLFNVRNAVKEICGACSMILVDSDTIESALDLHEKYGYAYYDSLIITSALESDCKYLLTEDMADGQIVDKSLTIRNIFREDIDKSH